MANTCFCGRESGARTRLRFGVFLIFFAALAALLFSLAVAAPAQASAQDAGGGSFSDGAALASDGEGAHEAALSASTQITTQRIFGSDAIATNYETVKADIDTNGAPNGLIICTNGHYIDSLSAAALSGLLDYPIVIVSGTDESLSETAKSTIDYASYAASSAGKKLDIVILGGNAAVSDGIKAQLDAYDTDSNCERVFGKNGYDTNIAAYDYGAKRGTWSTDEVLIATGNDYYDALGSGSYAAAKQAFILLTNQYSEGTNAAVYERATNSAKATICGGTAAVTDTTEGALRNTSKCTINRQWGDNAYQTNIAFAKYAATQGLTYENAGISTGTGYWDALGSSHILGASNSVMFLVSPDENNNQDVYAQLRNSSEVTTVRVFGGTAAVTSTTQQAIEKAKDPAALQAFAVYSADDQSLDFYKRTTIPQAGSTFNGKTATAVFNVEEGEGSGISSTPEWLRGSDYSNLITTAEIVDAGITPKSIGSWFANCRALMKVSGLDKLEISSGQNAAYMFMNCTSLTEIKGLDSWDMSNITYMAEMFNGCTALSTIEGIEILDTSNVTGMQYMFNNCTSLTADCSKWDVSKVINHTKFNENASGVTAPNWVN